MRLEGTSVICDREECPLCQGCCLRMQDPASGERGLVPCSHVVPAIELFADALKWSLHFVEAPEVVH